MDQKLQAGRIRMLLALVTLCILLVALGTGGYFFWEFYRVKPITVSFATLIPAWNWNDGAPSVTPAEGELLAEVEVFHDELLAYLSFDFLRSREALAGKNVYLVTKEEGPRVVYRVLVGTGNNWLSVYDLYQGLREPGYVRSWRVFHATADDMKAWAAQTRIFVAAYNAPVQQKLESLSPAQLRDYTRRFMLFKSRVDPRLRKNLGPLPPPILPEVADQLAADIIAVADFYDLPLDVFLGIGAVENNYMDQRGDLEHGVWKRRAEPGDVVLRRRKGRVYVLNYATGVWQITRETLRSAHKIYLKDRKKGDRDYSQLPERLIPQDPLYLDEVNSHWLTLYAGALLRYLIDYFDGDLEKAIGAYNGGVGRPNMRYEEHVRNAATHARRVLEQAAAINSQSMTEAGILPR